MSYEPSAIAGAEEIALKAGQPVQVFCFYNAWVDASNYDRLEVKRVDGQWVVARSKVGIFSDPLTVKDEFK